ncbi:MAG TPA: hypothetical protein VKU87_02350 [Thermomicrobiaceae bacterium]|nr:hypothetical protein [Thermomicrobiaceae bacterium]
MHLEITALIIIPIVIFVASIALTFVALALDSWKLGWAAALASLFLAIITGFSIGPYLFLVTCLQIGAALFLRWRLTWRGALALQLLAATVWFMVVPFQIFVFNAISLLAGMLLVTILAALATIWSPERQAGSRAG